MENSKKVVYVVHCIDVEGPMKEPLDATFGRLKEEDFIALDVEPTKENLEKLQSGELDLGVSKERADFLRRKYSSENLNYLETWDQIKDVMDHALSDKFRLSLADSAGKGYVYNWFIFDQFGFETNPRFKSEGIHNVWDFYHENYLGGQDCKDDGVYWHYHHPPRSGDAIEWNTNLWMNDTYEQVLARRVIERNWFPSVFRAGGHIERNDFSYWLEMFVPFDYSGRTPHQMDYQAYRGDVCDWRFGPTEWGAWHPDFYDYRRTGSMNRWIFRCLDLKTWIISLTERDVREAFEQADERGMSILAYYNHDYRMMHEEAQYGHDLVCKISKEFPDIEFRYANALDAAKALLGKDDDAPEFTVTFEGTLMTIESSCELFGPMPFLAIQEDGYFFRDNLTQENSTTWCYRFRKPELVQAVGIAGNSKMGNTGVKVVRAPFDNT